MALDRDHFEGEQNHPADHELIDARLGALGLRGKVPISGVTDPDPTVTMSGANAASTVTNPQATTYVSNPALFRMRGGKISTKITAGVTMAYVESPADPPSQSVAYSVEFATPGSECEIELGAYGTNVNLRVWVDGRIIPVSPAVKRLGARSYTTSGNATHRLKLAFTGRAPQGKRQIKVEISGAGFRGVTLAKQDQLSPPAESQPVQTVAWLGDSFTEGTNADTMFSSMAYVCSYQLGWDNIIMGSQGGTGYIAPGPTGRKKIGDRVPEIIALKPDHVVVPAGYNDQGSYSSAQVGAAARQVFSDLRSGLPEAQLWATGPWSLYSPTVAIALAFATEIKAAVEAQRGNYIDMYTVPWITGTGSAGTPPNPLNGNAGLYVTSAGDPHPTPEGHEFYGYMLAQAIATVLAKPAS